MAKMNFGGVIEEVMTREEFPLEKAREILKDRPSRMVGYQARHSSLSKRLLRRVLS